jgi:hypothetical protein
VVKLKDSALSQIWQVSIFSVWLSHFQKNFRPETSTGTFQSANGQKTNSSLLLSTKKKFHWSLHFRLITFSLFRYGENEVGVLSTLFNQMTTLVINFAFVYSTHKIISAFGRSTLWWMEKREKIKMNLEPPQATSAWLMESLGLIIRQESTHISK